MKRVAVVALSFASALGAASAAAQESFPSRLVTVVKAWHDAELKRLDREIRAIGKIESRT